MNISYFTRYEIPKTQEEKYELMNFVFENADSFVMNTFGFLWESRGWWDKFPIQVAREGRNIIGIHAFTLGTKAEDTIKTYYIVTHKKYRGYGIAKDMTFNMLRYNQLFAKKYYVNSIEGSEGQTFYERFIPTGKKTINEFGTVDIEFEANIIDVLK